LSSDPMFLTNILLIILINSIDITLSRGVQSKFLLINR
jgi:hypothetical protein